MREGGWMQTGGGEGFLFGVGEVAMLRCNPGNTRLTRSGMRRQPQYLLPPCMTGKNPRRQ